MMMRMRRMRMMVEVVVSSVRMARACHQDRLVWWQPCLPQCERCMVFSAWGRQWSGSLIGAQHMDNMSMIFSRRLGRKSRWLTMMHLVRSTMEGAQQLNEQEKQDNKLIHTTHMWKAHSHT